MIVDPDFFDHWRTGMVADAIGDPMAAIYIMRLWAHCQRRKSDTFVMPPAGIKAQCKCPAPADVFEKALIDAGFLARDGDTVTALGWAEQNASLIAAWGNGGKGGRPRNNPSETHGKPMGNPADNPAGTHGQPSANPDETDKSRGDKTSPSLRSGGSRKRSASPQAIPAPDDVDAQVWADWLQLRKAKKAPVTPTVLGNARAEAAAARMTLEAFLRIWCARGSQGLQADWIKPHERPAQGPPSKSFAERDADNARQAAAAWSGGRLGKTAPQDPDYFDMEATGGTSLSTVD